MDFIQNGAGAVTRDIVDKVRERVSVEDFAPLGLSWSDDWSAVFTAAAASMPNGGVIYAENRYTLYRSPDIQLGVSVVGPHASPDQIRFSDGGDYDAMRGVIFVRSTPTGIACKGFGGWRGLIIMREGLNLPFADAAAATAGVAAFSGRAFTNVGPGTRLEDLLILGFDEAIYSDSYERLRVRGVRGDCTNGIIVKNAYDIPELEDCHFWPYTTVHRTWTTPELLRRSGTAYFLNGVNDWMRVVRCFCYGYFRGFHARHVNDVTFFMCGADNTSSNGVGTHLNAIGFVVDGSCARPRWIACQAAAQQYGYYYANTSTTKGTMLACDAWGSASANLNNVSGTLVITDGPG